MLESSPLASSGRLNNTSPRAPYGRSIGVQPRCPPKTTSATVLRHTFWFVQSRHNPAFTDRNHSPSTLPDDVPVPLVVGISADLVFMPAPRVPWPYTEMRALEETTMAGAEDFSAGTTGFPNTADAGWNSSFPTAAQRVPSTNLNARA
jgi:hypothetical protein